MIEVNYKFKLENFLLDASFTMPEMGITVLFGPSGSGKTSLLNLMSGLINKKSKDLSSKFIINNRTLDDSIKNITLEPWDRKIAYVFQDHRLFPHMTTKDNILFGYKRCDSKLNPEELIEKFKIRELLEHYPDQLSGGQKQRVSMVRALLSQPELLILDEPLAALDYKSRQELLPYIECIHKELDIPMIYVSHDIKEVLRLADYILIMDKGKIIDQGDIADLCISQPLLTQEEGASFILDATVTKIIEEDKLVELDCGETILITAENMQLKQNIRLLIHARDVSLCLTPPQNSSILNCVPVCIENLETDNNGKLRVMAKIGKQTLVSLISHRSARQLNIEKGREMFAQFKATAMIK